LSQDLEAEAPRPYALEPARRPLIALATLASIATVTGTFMYAYPETMAPIRGEMVLVHDVSGDLMIVVTFWYLWVHLKRTFGLKKRAVSTWTGYTVVSVMAILYGTGVWGQIEEMAAGTPLHGTHLATAVIVIMVGCFHGVFGMRRRLR